MALPLARVLVLDGFDESREASTRELRKAGFDVVAVEEEDEAVAAVADAAARVDLVVLDVPVAEAAEAALALRRASSEAARPGPLTLIALVAPSDSRAVRESAHDSGIDYVLLRPCPPPALASHLRRLLAPRRRGG